MSDIEQSIRKGVADSISDAVSGYGIAVEYIHYHRPKSRNGGYVVSLTSDGKGLLNAKDIYEVEKYIDGYVEGYLQGIKHDK